MAEDTLVYLHVLVCGRGQSLAKPSRACGLASSHGADLIGRENKFESRKFSTAKTSEGVNFYINNKSFYTPTLGGPPVLVGGSGGRPR